MTTAPAPQPVCQNCYCPIHKETIFTCKWGKGGIYIAHFCGLACAAAELPVWADIWKHGQAQNTPAPDLSNADDDEPVEVAA